MSIISLIIKREFIAKVRNKSFIVMTFLSPLLFVGIAAFVGYLSSMKADTKRVAIHDETGLFINEFKVLNTKNSEYIYHDLSAIDIKFLKDSITNESYEGLLYIPKVSNPKDLESKIQFISNESPSISFIENIQGVIEKKLTKENFEKAKLDTLAIKNAEANVNISLAKASGEESVKGLNEIKIAIGGAFGYLIMMFIIIYGNMVMRSVIEEKTNRIVEIIISSVKPFQLMMGKIVGTALAGLLQFLIWTLIGLTLMFAASTFFGIDASPVAKIPPAMIHSAQQEFAGTAQIYIKELWALPIATILGTYFGFILRDFFKNSAAFSRSEYSR